MRDTAFLTRRTGWITAACALTVALAAVVFLLQPAGRADAPEPPGDEIRVMHYNLCGAAAGCAWNAGGSGQGTSIERVVKEAGEFSPDVISLNEICQDQYEALRRKLASIGRPVEGAFGKAQNNVENCGPSGAFGTAVLLRTSFAGVVPEDRRYTDTGGETYTGRSETVAVRRGLLCVTSLLGVHPLRACTTHANAAAPAQVEELRGWLDDEAAFPSSIPTLIAGDFNQQPNTRAMSHLYGSRFVEADQGNTAWFSKGSTGGVVCPVQGTVRCRNGAPTAGERKIDYIFADERHFSLGDPAQVQLFPESDHAMMKARFILRPAAGVS